MQETTHTCVTCGKAIYLDRNNEWRSRLGNLGRDHDHVPRSLGDQLKDVHDSSMAEWRRANGITDDPR